MKTYDPLKLKFYFQGSEVKPVNVSDSWIGPRCCALAVVRPCVCDIHTVCPTHGEKHHGTHD